MKNFILIISFLVVFKGLCAQTPIGHEKLTREADYTLEFPDTTYTAVLHVICVYDDSRKDDYYQIFLAADVKEGAEADFTLNKQLSFDVFADKFCSKTKEKFGYEKSPTIVTLYKVYQLIWSIKNGEGDAPVAGILQFSRGVLVFGLREEEKGATTYIQRREKADSISNLIIDAEADARASRQKFERALKKDTSTLSENIRMLQELKARAYRINGGDELADYQASLTSLVETYQFSPDNINALIDSLAVDDNSRFEQNVNRLIIELKKLKETVTSAYKTGTTDLKKIYRTDVQRSFIDTLYTDARAKRDSINKKNRNNFLVVDSTNNHTYLYSRINKTDFKFEAGFIESVKVWITIGGSEYIFENIFAIGFSSVSNYRRIAHTKLIVRNGTKDTDGWYIYLSDIFRNYDNQLNNYTRDYSPADTAFSIIPAEVPQIILRKERYVNLIDAKLYVDLKGIDKTKPNGLFQIELKKRFNINTARLQAGLSRSDYGFFNYLDIFGSLSKIEQNNRELVLRNTNITDINGNLISPSYATNLDFARYENYSAGVNLGVMLFDKPDYKFTAYLDFGIKYGHAIIADTVLTSSGDYIKPFLNQLEAHTLTFQFPKISLELFSESRITPRISWQLNNTKLLSNNQYKQVLSYEKSDANSLPIEKHAGISNQYEIFVKVAPDRNRTSHMFLRWRLYTQFGDANTSFSQIQVGYTYNWTTAR